MRYWGESQYWYQQKRRRCNRAVRYSAAGAVSVYAGFSTQHKQYVSMRSPKDKRENTSSASPYSQSLTPGEFDFRRVSKLHSFLTTSRSDFELCCLIALKQAT